MGFEALLGNDRVKQNLRSALEKGRTSHFYLISGPVGSGKHTLARLLAAALMCQSQDRPCGTCPACRKVLADIHPDYITVDDPEKKIFPVDLVRDTIADMYIRPNEAPKKVYLFPRGQDMRDPSQNALLKILEEPPAYGVFILLTTNPQTLLPTVRSRGTALQLQAVAAQELLPWLQQRFPDREKEVLLSAIRRGSGFPGQVLALLEDGVELPPQTRSFLTAYAARDSYGILQVLSGMEKWKRDQLIPMLLQWMQILEGALLQRSGGNAVTPMAQQLSASRDSRELLQAVRALQKTVQYAQLNVSPAAICGWLTFALR